MTKPKKKVKKINKKCQHDEGLTGDTCTRCGFFEGTCDRCEAWIAGDEKEGYEELT